jgi:transposase-like protein
MKAAEVELHGGANMDFPLSELLDEEACYQKLLKLMHPGGLQCPQCGERSLHVHRRHRGPVLDYRCGHCGRVFNAWTGTTLQKTHRRPSELLLILRGIAQGQSTAGLARELRCGRGHLLDLRHKMQERGSKALWQALEDTRAEADEMYQNAGEKRGPAWRSGRSAPAAGQQGQRPRHLDQ